MSSIQILNPDSLGKPLGQYSQLTRVKASEFLFIAGQVGAGKDGKAASDFDAQCGFAFANIGAALASQGAGFGNASSRPISCIRRTSRNSLPTASANFRNCSRAAHIRRTRCSSLTAWCARSF